MQQTEQTFEEVKAKMLQQAEAQKQRIRTGEERIASELTTLITSLKNIVQMSPEDVAANAYEFAMLSYCELWNHSTDPIPTKVRLKAAQVLEEVYLEIGKQEGKEGMFMLLQAEIDKQQSLWKHLQELCQLSPDEVYKADWDKFFIDTGGFTINSLASYNLLDRLDMYLENGQTYHIKIKEQVNVATTQE